MSRPRHDEEEIVIEIDLNGEVSAEKTCGHQGPLCLHQIEELLDGVGRITDTKKKREFNQVVKKTTAKKVYGKGR